MKVEVKNLSNEVVRQLDLPDEVFGYLYKEHLIHVVVEGYRAGMRSGTHKVKDAELVVVDTVTLEGPKTKALATRLAGLGVVGKALLVDDRDNQNLALAARNNPRLKAVDALGVNVYDVVDRGHLVLSEQALGRLVEVLTR